MVTAKIVFRFDQFKMDASELLCQFFFKKCFSSVIKISQFEIPGQEERSESLVAALFNIYIFVVVVVAISWTKRI